LAQRLPARALRVAPLAAAAMTLADGERRYGSRGSTRSKKRRARLSHRLTRPRTTSKAWITRRPAIFSISQECLSRTSDHRRSVKELTKIWAALRLAVRDERVPRPSRIFLLCRQAIDCWLLMFATRLGEWNRKFPHLNFSDPQELEVTVPDGREAVAFPCRPQHGVLLR
jgi:hypothetical protein